MAEKTKKFNLHDIVKDSYGFQGRVYGYYNDTQIEVRFFSGLALREESELAMVKKFNV